MGEADILATILTRDYGKGKFTFKGLKKSRKRPRSAGEPGTLLSLVYYHHDNRDISTVNEFHVEYQPVKLRDRMAGIFTLYFLLELTEKTMGFNDDSGNIFELLRSGIRVLDDAENPSNLSVFYILHLLRFHGIIPDFKSCRSCGEEGFTSFILEISDLSPVCSSCYRGSLEFLGVDTRNFINTSLTTRYGDIDQSRFSPGEISNLLFNLILFIENYYHINIKSKEFLNFTAGS